jgi:hypothetical protein
MSIIPAPRAPVAHMPPALEAAERKYTTVRGQYAAAEADLAAALRQLDKLKPATDAALSELSVLRATAEQDRLLGSIGPELKTKIEIARAETDRCLEQYRAAEAVWLDALVVSQQNGSPTVLYRGDGTPFTAPPARRVENAGDLLDASRVVLALADDEWLAANARLQALERQIEWHLRRAQDAEGVAEQKARDRRILGRLAGRARGTLRNDH